MLDYVSLMEKWTLFFPLRPIQISVYLVLNNKDLEKVVQKKKNYAIRF